MPNKINWTNESVLAFAGEDDPIEVIRKASQNLVLQAREKGWKGPPFNPIQIAEMLGAELEANSNISDARLVTEDNKAVIQFNPQQPRERVRFSIAHEVAHLLFPDWGKAVRNRGGSDDIKDDWQLEMLCNLAASEFVLPIGSLKSQKKLPDLEALMKQRRKYDVSAEAFLIRVAKTSDEPVMVVFASPKNRLDQERSYRVDYSVSSPTSKSINVRGMDVPNGSVIHNCTAIGFTDSAIETWISGKETLIECVGIPSYPGSIFPRVACLIKLGEARTDAKPIATRHGDILKLPESERIIVCQLVNNKASKWGGGIAKRFARKFPDAEAQFTHHIRGIAENQRMGEVIFTQATGEITIASLVGQDGYGPSLFPRIRYEAVYDCLNKIAEKAEKTSSKVYLPKIGTGAAGGDWDTIEEILDEIFVRRALSVTVIEQPPKREQFELF